VFYRGERLAIDWAATRARQPLLQDQVLRLGGPADTLAARVQRWLEAEALRLGEQDLAHYCAAARQPVPEFGLSRALRRWGSCSGERDGARRRIRLNWRLIQAPDHVRRSVVAHEVTHLVHFDHSPAFHRLLESLFEGDLKGCDDWLRREGRGLYASFG
jgi:predicted metal-dependent hydrolase